MSYWVLTAATPPNLDAREAVFRACGWREMWATYAHEWTCMIWAGSDPSAMATACGWGCREVPKPASYHKPAKPSQEVMRAMWEKLDDMAARGMPGAWAALNPLTGHCEYFMADIPVKKDRYRARGWRIYWPANN